LSPRARGGFGHTAPEPRPPRLNAPVTRRRRRMHDQDAANQAHGVCLHLARPIGAGRARPARPAPKGACPSQPSSC
jgi:hypothetical protein